MIQGLLREIAAQGARGAVVPFTRIDDLKKDMLALKNGAFHTVWLDRMANHITTDTNPFIPPGLTFTPRSLISVVIPSAPALLRFSYHGQPVDCVVPAHYINWEMKNQQVLQGLTDRLAPRGFCVAMAVTLPQKLLAVHCGLARYGRNNIAYHDEFGSHTQIMTYISDLPCGEAAWFPLERMGHCETCRACVSACPTAAIDASRRLIDANRCLTFMNEFPEWLDPSAHNSIIGCTKCQDCCPANAQNRDNTAVGATFTEAETAEILSHQEGTPYLSALAEKIGALGISPEFVRFFPRNLSVLLKNKQ